MAPIGLPAFGQNATVSPPSNAGPVNPKLLENTTTAYQYLQAEANATGLSDVKTQLQPLNVTTNLPTYNQGDKIVMSGYVRDIQNGTDVSVIVFNPTKSMVSIGQLPVTSSGSFTQTFLATGPLWTTAGTYTILAQYGPDTNVTKTFQYSGGTGTATIAQSITSTYNLQSGSQSYSIPYTIQGATVTSMSVLASTYTLQINLSPATAAGSISVTLPRALIDAKTLPPVNPDANLTKGVAASTGPLPDTNFIVTIGGKAVTPASDVRGPTTRTLSIPFNAGDSTIDIVGTIIVPEFGPIAALVLAIAIISIIAVSAKTGLRFMPKY
ncbi:MAG: PEFG-CTERM sorting domain-containing protein [Nitrosotalea sp.]